MNENQVTCPCGFNMYRSRHGGDIALTRVALLEDILALWGLHLIGIEKLLESGSSGRRTNEALRDGRSQMGTGKEGQCTIFPSALLQGDPEPKRSRRGGVLLGSRYDSGADQNQNRRGVLVSHTRNVL